ncbi:MAG: hypothetical protein ABGW92_06820 [Methanocaldococcus sp.]
MVLKIKDNIYCMGFIEWKVKEYRSLDITKGTTYIVLFKIFWNT